MTRASNASCVAGIGPSLVERAGLRSEHRGEAVAEGVGQRADDHDGIECAEQKPGHDEQIGEADADGTAGGLGEERGPQAGDRGDVDGILVGQPVRERQEPFDGLAQHADQLGTAEQLVERAPGVVELVATGCRARDLAAIEKQLADPREVARSDDQPGLEPRKPMTVDASQRRRLGAELGPQRLGKRGERVERRANVIAPNADRAPRARARSP